MYYRMLLGIEHFATGIQLHSSGSTTLQFVIDTPSTFQVLSNDKFEAYWGTKQAFIEAEQVDGDLPNVRSSHGEAEHYAQNVRAAMDKVEERSRLDMQTYTRTEYPRLAHKEPYGFPTAVVKAMRRKHGKDADKYLAMLRWDRDHWYYTHAGMYVGVEPDGYIHT